MDLIKASVAPVASTMSFQSLRNRLTPIAQSLSRLYFGIDLLPCAELTWQQIWRASQESLAGRVGIKG